MTLPLLAGSALKSLSCLSPSDSKVTPTSQSSSPMTATGATPRPDAALTWIGSETNQTESPWIA
jgi:hypothetical protein